MIRATDAMEIAPGVYMKTLYGLHDDTKPTDGIANGSVFIEIDTSDAYFFDEEHTTWVKAGGSSNG